MIKEIELSHSVVMLMIRMKQETRAKIHMKCLKHNTSVQQVGTELFTKWLKEG